jgi:tetratricopeptide (TPR) repeat protein
MACCHRWSWGTWCRSPTPRSAPRAQHARRPSVKSCTGDAALADLDSAVQHNPTDAHLITYRGMVYHEIGCYDEALADMNRAIEFDPDDGEYRSQRSEILLLMGRSDNSSLDQFGS